MGIPSQFSPLMHRLSAEAQSMVQFDYHRRRKSKTVGYLAWFFLGWHYLYLRRVGLQFAFWITAGGLLIWWFVDLFRVGPIVNRMNEDLARDLITQYQSIYREPDRNQVLIMQPALQTPAISSPAHSLALPANGGTIAYQNNSTAALYVDQDSYATAKNGLAADSIKLLVIAGSILAGLVVLGIALGGDGREATSQGAPVGVYAAYQTTGLANVRDGPFSRSERLGSLEPGTSFHGTAELGPNGIARWVKIEDGPFNGGYVSAVNLEVE